MAKLEEDPRPGFMAEIYASLTPEEKRFISDAASMYEDGFDRRRAGEIALGVVLERRGDQPERFTTGIDPRQRTTSEQFREGMRTRPTPMSYRTAGDARPLSTIEGQKLARDFAEAIDDDDFMKLSIAQMIEKSRKPTLSEALTTGTMKESLEKSEDIIFDAFDKLVRDTDPMGIDDARSPYGIFSEPIPPKKKKRK